MRRRADAFAAQGRKIVDFGAGEPDFDVPEPIREAAIRAIREGRGHYVDPRGLSELRSEIVRFEATRHAQRSDPAQIVVTAGSFAGLSLATRAILEPGDEVIVIEPCWGPYRSLVALTGATAVGVAMPSPGGRFVLDPQCLSAALTAKTKAIVLNTPWNPTGRVLTPAELSGVAQFAESNDLWIIADEVYSELVFDGSRHTSIATLGASIAARTICVTSMSKSFAMTGWRLGYCVAPPEVAEVLARLNHYTTRCATSIVQYAALAALTDGLACVEEMRREYQRRRDVIVAGLNAIDGIECPAPEGTFYAFAAIPRDWGGSRSVAGYLLERHGVVLTPGAAYGPSSASHLRLSFATSVSTIDEGLARLRSALPPPFEARATSSGELASEH